MKKKLIPLFVALIIIVSVPLTSFAQVGDFSDSDLRDFGFFPFYNTPYIFVYNSSYNNDSFIIYFPSDKLNFIHYDFAFDQLINTSSTTITTVGYDSSGEAYTFRMTSFGSLEIREYYGVNMQQSRYVPFFSLSAFFEISNSNFLDSDLNNYWYHFDTYQMFIICLVVVILFFTVLNWWLLHKSR